MSAPISLAQRFIVALLLSHAAIMGKCKNSGIGNALAPSDNLRGASCMVVSKAGLAGFCGAVLIAPTGGWTPMSAAGVGLPAGAAILLLCLSRKS